MGATQKVFDNPQHEYTRNAADAVPQLHKKWEGELGAEVEAIGATSQDQDRGRPRPLFEEPAFTPLWACVAARGVGPQAVATERGVCRGSASGPTPTCGPTEEVPPLVEIEEEPLRGDLHRCWMTRLLLGR